MSVHDPHAGPRPAPSWGVRRFTPSWRWLSEAMWWVEHAFGRAHANARPEEDTRVRIFVILSAFSLVFVCLTLGAVHAAVLRAGGGGGSASHPNAVVRADLIDRNGALLATPTSSITASISIRPRSGIVRRPRPGSAAPCRASRRPGWKRL